MSTIYGVMHHVEERDASPVKAAKEKDKKKLKEKVEKEEVREKKGRTRRRRIWCASEDLWFTKSIAVNVSRRLMNTGRL